jgi:hypothetical protein
MFISQALRPGPEPAAPESLLPPGD